MKRFTPFIFAMAVLTPLVWAAQLSMTYDSSTRSISPTDGKLTVSLFTNSAATASTLAGYDANKKLITRQAVNADIASAAGIDVAKLGNGNVSNNELSLLSGLTAIGNVVAG